VVGSEQRVPHRRHEYRRPPRADHTLGEDIGVPVALVGQPDGDVDPDHAELAVPFGSRDDISDIRADISTYMG
jgi:hypothetical protein